MKHYEILGLQRDATPVDIKAAYRTMAQKHHPDKGGDADHFAAVNAAYMVLSDPEKRQHYDETGEEAEAFNLPAELAQLLLAALDRIQNPSTQDLLKVARNLVQTNIRNTEKAIADNNAKIAKVDTCRERVLRKDGDNIIADMLLAQADAMRKGSANAGNEIAKGHKLLAALEEYSYRVDTFVPPKADTFFTTAISDTWNK